MAKTKEAHDSGKSLHCTEARRVESKQGVENSAGRGSKLRGAVLSSVPSLFSASSRAATKKIMGYDFALVFATNPLSVFHLTDCLNPISSERNRDQ